ncbi:MAG: hypothetical protein LC100_15285 [Chitinophagales bacterium]|nr:hypothetical protein [Chitinophagales bacterium]
MCEVTLSKEGAEYLSMKRKEFYDTHPQIKIRGKEIFEEGEVYKTQFWSLMNDFGEMMQLGIMAPFESGKITIDSCLES